MPNASISSVLPWALFVLGVGHILYGSVKFRVPLMRAISTGFVGKFGSDEGRSAFWFVMFGPLLMLAGQLAIHAAAVGDAHMIRVIGAYLIAVCIVGVAALPKSPFLVGLVLASLLLALGFGLI